MRIIFSLTNSRALILKMTIVFFKMLPKMTQMTIYDNSFLRLLSKRPSKTILVPNLKISSFGRNFEKFEVASNVTIIFFKYQRKSNQIRQFWS